MVADADGARVADAPAEVGGGRDATSCHRSIISHYALAVAEWETVRTVASHLPQAEESTGSRPAFRVGGKLFAWTARERDGGGLAVRVDREEKHLLLESNPEVYFSSPHYERYPGVQIRLEVIDTDGLRDRLEDAWLIQAPKRLAREFLAAEA